MEEISVMDFYLINSLSNTLIRKESLREQMLEFKK
jgi:hypothetical protein